MLQKQYQISSTKNYAMFKYIGGNRIIDERRVLSVMDKMKNFPETVAPAQCNEKFEIIDGQHRLEASKRLGRPFYYYVVKGASIETVRAINDHDPRWSTAEFVNSFSTTGNKDYEMYEEFEKKYKLGHAINIMLLSDTETFYNQMLNDFKIGGFKVKNLKKAEEVAEMLLTIKELYAGYKKRSFAVAFVKISTIPGFNFSTFIEKLRYQQKKMVDCTNATHYIELLGEIYNYKARKGSIIDVTSLLYRK
jgi:hypothetical protein